MAAAAKPRPPVRALDLNRVVAWRLSRQRLSGPHARDPVTVARDLVGVQAQVLASAALSIALRTGGRVEATARGLEDRQLLRLWAQRGTLHIFAADDVPTVVAARSTMEPWRRPAWLRYFGVTERQMERAIEAVGDILGDGKPRTRAELSEAMAEEYGKPFAELVRGSWGGFLKQAGNKGYVAQAWTGDSSVAFVRPDKWLDRWRTEDPDEANRVLVLRYLAAYGPATATEINRWWGMPGAGLKPVLRQLGDEVTEVEVDGRRGLVRTEDLDEIERAILPDGDDGVRFLGPFDPLTVGAGMRDHLIPAKHLARVSRTAGWISPVLLVDGRAAGVWDSRRTSDRLAITVDLFGRARPGLKAAIARAAGRVADAQGASASVAYGQVFTTTKPAPEGMPTPEYPLRRCPTRSSTSKRRSSAPSS
jgi:hypothetical protein